MADWGDLRLSERHLEMLRDESAIAPDVAAERGYCTADTAFEVPEIFGKVQRRRVPALVIPIYGVDGRDEPVSYQIRPDEPRVDGRSGKPVKYESPPKRPQVLDVPRRVQPKLSDPGIPLWITEGARKSDAAASIGLACVSLAGVWNFKGVSSEGGKTELPDWDRVAVNGRVVYICFDSDVVTKPPVRQAMKRLAGMLTRRGADVKIVVLGAGPAGKKHGLDDAVASGATEADLISHVQDGFLDEERSEAAKLIDTILGSYDLGRADSGVLFAAPKTGPRVIRKLGTALVDDVAARLFDENGTLVKRADSDAVLSVLRGKAGRLNPSALHLRSVRHSNGLITDLGDTDGDVLVVTPKGWRVAAPRDTWPLFRRPSTVQPLPRPAENGSVEPLRKLLGLDADDPRWRLILGWLVAAIFPHMPRPLLDLIGVQGSGKTTRGVLVVSVWNPVEELGRKPGRNPDNDVVRAYNSFLVSYDNVSKVSEEVSNFLCRLVTGESEEKRQLYSDGELVSLAYRRTGVITSVNKVSGLGPDALERIIPVEFDRIDDEAYTSEEQLLRAFHRVHPTILAGLADLISGVLTHLPAVRREIKKLPRMADYGLVLAALDRHLGTDVYLSTYTETISTSFAEYAEEDVFTGAVVAFMKDRRWWVGTAGDLLNDLERPLDAGWWPDSPRGLSGALRRSAEMLRAAGVTVEFLSRAHGGKRQIALTREENGDGSEQPSPNRHHTVTTLNKSTASENTSDGDGGDGSDGSPLFSDSSERSSSESSTSGKETDSDESCSSSRKGGRDTVTTVPTVTNAGQRGDGCGDGWVTVDSTVTVPFDIETADAKALWTYGRGYVRLCGYRNGSGGTAVTADPDELVRTLSAGVAVGHNILGFDLIALARYHGLDLHALVDAGRVLDTKLAAFLADPPGARMNAKQIEKYYSLDETGTRLLGTAKTGDLKALARKYGGFDHIPLDHPGYTAYLRGDVDLTARLADTLPVTDYVRREHRVAAVAAQLSLNGFRVNTDLVAERLDDGRTRRAELLEQLRARYGLPTTKKDGTESKSPHHTEEGRAAIIAAFTDLGVKLPKTAKGTPSAGKDALDKVTTRYADRPDVLDLVETVRSLNGIRTIYETIDANLVGDRVHPWVNLRQASGRWSITDPGLTVIGKRGGRSVEREVFLPDPGEVLISADLSQVDARAVAALCQDRGYLELFRPGVDAHEEIARMVWGSKARREDAKAIGHGWNYGMGILGLARNAGVSEKVARQFDHAMRERFPRLVEWRDEVRERAKSGELLDNGFGRFMRPDPDRSWTQGPALMGQGCARDLMMEGLLRLPHDVLPMLRAVVHDEVVLSAPEDDVDEVEQIALKALSVEWAPTGCSHSVSVVAGLADNRGRNWGHVYEKGANG